MKTKAQASGGYILPELILALIVSTIISSALLAGLVALIRGLQPPNVTLAGEKLPVAPTFGSFPSAVRLHQALTRHLTSARAVYVFGGRHLSIPADAPPTTIRPLRLRTLPIISDFSPGLPMDAKTFYDRYSSALGEFEPANSADDFTILMIDAADAAFAPSCMVQVRRRDITVTDGTSTTAFIVRDVRMWEESGTQRYSFAERRTAAEGVFVGVVHTWMRYNAALGVAEEGPACAIFPDPWVYAGTRGRSDDVPAFSRFSYLIPVSR